MNSNTPSPSGIAQLPPEVLSQVFIDTLPDVKDLQPPSTSTSPVLLCSVCKAWLDIALSTPQLWSKLRLGTSALRLPSHTLMMEEIMDVEEGMILPGTVWDGRSVNGSALRRRLVEPIHPWRDEVILQKYIERSGNTPLSIALTYPLSIPTLATDGSYGMPVNGLNSREGVFDRPFQLALRHTHRWQHIALSSHILNRRYVSTFFPDPLPLLESLYLASTPIDEIGLTSQPIIPLHAFTFDDDFHRPSAIWFPNLRCLTITGASPSMADLFLLLMHTPRLESCTVQLYRGGHLAFGPELLLLPYMKKLDLLIGRDFNLAMLFERLLLPNLESFKLNAAGMTSRPIWVDVAKLLTRSMKTFPPEWTSTRMIDAKLEDAEHLPAKESTLRELKLLRHPMTPMPAKDVMQCLRAAPNIRLLHVEGAYLTDDILAGLTLSNSSSAPVEFPGAPFEDSAARTGSSSSSGAFKGAVQSALRERSLSIGSARMLQNMVLPALDYCPHLRAIRLIYPGPLRFTAQAIRRMILSRCDPELVTPMSSELANSSAKLRRESCLREVYIAKCHADIMEDVLAHPGIGKCVENGLSLSIRKSRGDGDD